MLPDPRTRLRERVLTTSNVFSQAPRARRAGPGRQLASGEMGSDWLILGIR